MIFYCPNCWSRVKEHQKTCHKCHEDIESLDHRSYFEKLVSALNHSERTTRIRAAYILGELKDKRAVKPLAKAISGSRGIRDIFLEEAVVVALGKIGGEDALPILIGLLDHPSFLIRADALHSLSRFKTKQAAQAIKKALSDPSPSVYELARRILSSIGRHGRIA